MKQLDLEIALRRAKRADAKPKRAAALAGAIILILAGALGALLFLQQMLSGLPRQNRENLRGSPVGHSQ